MATELFVDLLEAGKDLRVRVSGRSMAPTLRDGDFVTLRKAHHSSIGRGDLVLFRQSPHRSLALHRIVGIRGGGEEKTILTRGDALLRCDRPVRASSVLARAIRIERNTGGEAGVVDLDSFPRRLSAAVMVCAAPLLALGRRLVSGPRRPEPAAPEL